MTRFDDHAELDDHAESGCNKSAGCVFGHDDCPVIAPERAKDEPLKREKSPREWADLPIEKKPSF